MRTTLIISLALIALSSASPAMAKEVASLTRIDAQSVTLNRGDIIPVGIWISKDDQIDADDKKVDGALMKAAAKGDAVGTGTAGAATAAAQARSDMLPTKAC